MRLVMGNLSIPLKDLWVLASALQFVVFVVLVARKQLATHPALSAYIVITLLQAAFLYVLYALWGYESQAVYVAAWISQAIVISARSVAVSEICYQILGQYRGVWGLTWRIMATVASGVFVTAITLGRHDLERAVSTIDLGLECSMAAVLVVFFLFTKYYEVEVPEPHKYAGVAFCLYSCFRVLNDAVLQRRMREYSGSWNMVDAVTFLATLLLLMRASFSFQKAAAAKVVLLPRSAYANLVPQMNQRLHALNDRLGQLLKSETGKI
jgi:hypothetical protein